MVTLLDILASNSDVILRATSLLFYFILISNLPRYVGLRGISAYILSTSLFLLVVSVGAKYEVYFFGIRTNLLDLPAVVLLELVRYFILLLPIFISLVVFPLILNRILLFFLRIVFFDKKKISPLIYVTSNIVSFLICYFYLISTGIIFRIFDRWIDILPKEFMPPHFSVDLIVYLLSSYFLLFFLLIFILIFSVFTTGKNK